jgi:GMP synthase (glutamine-hydrolysing)
MQHVAFEDEAAIGAWAASRGHGLERTLLFEGQSPPVPEDYDWLVAMGGPMNIYEHDLFPWLAAEKKAISRCLEAEKPFLGVCLGAQLLADAAGGAVRTGLAREIGWLPVRLTREGRAADLFRDFPDEFTALHWHGDVVSLPPGAELLAVSEACPAQAFRVGRQAVGLQFHIEATPESLERLIANCAADITPGPFTHQPGQMRREARFEAIHALLFSLLDRMAAGRVRGEDQPHPDLPRAQCAPCAGRAGS